MARTNMSQRLGVDKVQGIGFSENTGSFPMPEARTGVITIVDGNDQYHTLVLDHSDGFFYDITTRDGPTGSGNTKIWTDKADTAGANGTDITPSVVFKEDRGNFEHYYINVLGEHIYVRPVSESEGYPSGLTIQADVYVDGEPTTPTATASDIDKTGEVVFDRNVEGHRVQNKITSNKAKIILTGRQVYYKAIDKLKQPEDRVTTEGDYQADLGLPVLWLSRGGNLLLDRSVGTAISGSVTAATGPDGKSNSAMTLGSALTLGNSAIASTGTLLFWAKSATYNTTFDSDNTVTISEVSNNGTWYMWKLTGAIPANLIFHTGADVFDIRIYDSTIATADMTYLYNDVISNYGDELLPLF